MPSQQEYGYRNRVQFKLYAGAADLQIGFFRNGTHFVEDAAQGCPISLPVINKALSRLRSVLASFTEPAAIPQINIECGGHGKRLQRSITSVTTMMRLPVFFGNVSPSWHP